MFTSKHVMRRRASMSVPIEDACVVPAAAPLRTDVLRVRGMCPVRMTSQVPSGRCVHPVVSEAAGQLFCDDHQRDEASGAPRLRLKRTLSRLHRRIGAFAFCEWASAWE